MLISNVMRSKVALVLHVLSLTIAFAACLVILMQVRYEMTFDKGYKTAGRIYQIDEKEEPELQYEPYIARPLAELSFATTPLIRASAVRDNFIDEYETYPLEKGASSAMSVKSYMASTQFPEVFGLELVRGSYQEFGTPHTAIISQGIASKIFNDADPIGKTLRLENSDNQREARIVAVYKEIPENSSLPNSIITSLGDVNLDNWNVQAYRGYVLIDSPEDAREAEKYIKNAIKDAYSITYDEVDKLIKLNNLHDRYFSPDNSDHAKGNKNTFYSLIAIAVIILCVAIINFINFSLATVPKRIKSINLRKILGSSPLALRMEQFAEAVTITCISVALALLLVFFLSGSTFTALVDANMALKANMPLVWMIIGVAVLTGLAAAVYPAYYSTSAPPVTVIHGNFALTRKGQRFRTVLITFQYTTSILLIIIAMAVLMQYNYMLKYDVGYATDRILTTRLTAPMLRQQNAVTDKLKQDPRIVDVAYSSENLVDAGSMWGLRYHDKMIVPYFFPVTPNFTSLMDIPILSGRDFTAEDQSSPGKYIFNETAQKEFDIRLGDYMQNHNRNLTAGIIGIAKDFNFKPLHYPIEPFALYVSGESMWELPYAYIKVHTQDLPGVMASIRATLLEYDPAANNVFKLEFLDQSIGNLYQKERNLAFLISVFSFLAVFISTIGALGLIYFEAQFRRREIGIRKIFGSSVRDILFMFNMKYIKVILVSFGLAVPASYIILRQWQTNFTYQADLPLWIYAVALLILLVVTIITVTIQSLAAANQPPLKSIR